MKLLIVFIALLIGSVPHSFGMKKQHFKKPVKANNGAGCHIQKEKTDSFPDYAVTINGRQNTVSLKTGSKEVQTSESLLSKTKAVNVIEISGRGNSISVNQNPNGKVCIKQNGNSNTIKLSQLNHQP